MKRIVLSVVLLVIALVLFFVGFFTCSLWSNVSAVISFGVAIYEAINSNRLEKKIKSYDKEFQTNYDKHNDITYMNYDCGTYNTEK